MMIDYQTYQNVIKSVAETAAYPQIKFITDSSRWSLALCSRQAGKNWALTRMMLLTALEKKGREIVYINDTYKNARDVMWIATEDGLPAVCDQLGIKYSENKTTLTITFKNGSYIQLMGADRAAWHALRGRRLDMIVADEMQRYEDVGLRNALSKVIPDCLMKRQGRFVGIGTPDEFCVGKFHDICEAIPDPITGVPQNEGWNVHRWTSKDLRLKTNVWKEQLAWAEMMKINTDPINGDPDWRREKLGQWVKNNQSLVHSILDEHLYDGSIPDLIKTRCSQHYKDEQICSCDTPLVQRNIKLIENYAGIDFGYAKDPMAIVVGSISSDEGCLREVHSEKRFHLDTSQLASWMKDLQKKYNIIKFYGDSAAAQTIADLKIIYGIPIEPASKNELQNSMNFWHSERESALKNGLIKILKGSELYKELLQLVRDPNELLKKRIRAKPGQDDHCFDAWRYLFRMVRTNHIKLPNRPLTTNEEKMKQIEKVVAKQYQQTNFNNGRRPTAGSNGKR